MLNQVVERKRIMTKRVLSSLLITFASFSGGVALAHAGPNDPSSQPSDSERLQVGDLVNGGRVVEVRGDEVFIEFVEPAPAEEVVQEALRDYE